MIAKKLEEVCDFISGLWTGKNPPYINVGVIRNTNFHKNGRLDFSDIAQLDVEAKQFSKRQLKFGDIVLEKSGGGPKQPVGRVCVFEKDEGLFSLSNFTSAIRIKNPKELDYKYLHYFLQYQYISGETEKIQTNSTGIRNLQLSLYKEFLVPIPSLPIQQKIVSNLEAVFIEIDNATIAVKANIKNVESLLLSYSYNVFEEIKTTWSEKLLGEICDVRDGTHDSPKYVEQGIPFVTQKNIRKEGLDLNDVKFITLEDHNKFYKRSNVSYGDILISMIGANRGMSAIVDDDRLFSIKNVCLVKQGNEVDQNYLLCFFKSVQAQKYIKLFSNGGAQEFIGLTALRKFPIPLPSKEIQEKVVENHNNISTLCKVIEKNCVEKLISLVKLKESILKQAFNGELVKE